MNIPRIPELALLLMVLATPVATAAGALIETTPTANAFAPTAATVEANADAGPREVDLAYAPPPARPVEAHAPASARLATRERVLDAGPARLDAGRAALDTRNTQWAHVALAADAPLALPSAPPLHITLGADATRVAPAPAPPTSPVSAAAAPVEGTAPAPDTPVPRALDARPVPPATPRQADERPPDAPVATTPPHRVAYAVAATGIAPTPLQAARAAALVAGAWLCVALPAWLLYHRIRSADTLAHGTRRDLHASVRAQPGITSTKAARALGIDPTTARYHLRLMERQGIVVAHEGRYFATGSVPPEARAAAVVAHDARDLLDAVRESPGAAKSELARRLQRSRAAVSWHLDRMQRVGLVRFEREGRTVRVWLRHPDTAEGACATRCAPDSS